MIIYGAIYSPVKKMFWLGKPISNDAFINSKKFKQKTVYKKFIKIIDNYPEPKGFIVKLLNRLPKTKYIECGSIGLKSILTLMGKADLFIKKSIFRDWDVAPAIAFADCIGGYVYDLNLKPIKIGENIVFEKGLVVTHNIKFIKLLEEILKEN